ncbi:hypothetical protein SAMN05444000_105187 [Shimia gijangensis]|uniref:Uncharacterized protein n=1 Tax=Shimia gijangensis TaxID=1470563 RepID=A0A1M6H0M8_9RHOB|nr:hypothetical protein [Shimia gijangensis]SHJ15767.1 hypothetical protein SAMN05444000_105187 [Shimia gijangensis]
MARPIKSVENYTTPALVMAWVNLFGLLTLIWVVFGFAAALLAVWVINRAISQLEARTRPH